MPATDRRFDLKRALEALPESSAPPGGWSLLSQVLDARRKRRRRLHASLAIAASVFLGAVAWFLPARTEQGDAVREPPASIRSLMAKSRELENTLAQLRHEAPVWDATSAARAAALERELCLVDLQLAYAGPLQPQDLWQSRVALMDRLVRTHREANLASTGSNEPSVDENTL